METLEYILIEIILGLTIAVNVAVEYITYKLINYIDNKIELMLLSLYLKNAYLDSLIKEMNKKDSISVKLL